MRHDLAEAAPTFAVMAPRAEAGFASTCEYVVRKAKCNIIFIKY